MRELALAAILEVADRADHVGDFLSEEATGDVLVVRYAATHPGYPHWHWSVALIPGDSGATVNEVWMEPGEGALPVPVWKPWSERIRPGDLGVGDVVPTDPADGRLTPGYTGEDLDPDDLQLLPEQWQPGLGRARVLSAEGLLEAAERWRSGEAGPDAQIARLAEFPCSTCAWLLPIGGPLGQAFGVCAHDMSPSDGHIVSLDHGCGAHSDVQVEPTPVPVTELIVDETRIDVLEPLDDAALSSAAAEAPTTSDDVVGADQPDGDASEGDIAPPEDIVASEDVVQEQGEDGQGGPDGGADDGDTDPIEVESA